MNNAILDGTIISAQALCEKLTKELGPMETEREHRINSIIVEMAQSAIQTVPEFQYKYWLEGDFDTNGDYQIFFPPAINIEGAFPGLKWDEDYDKYTFSFHTNNYDHIKIFLELLMVSFIVEPAQHKLIPKLYSFIEDFYNDFLAKEMVPTVKEYRVINEIYGEEYYEHTFIDLVRQGDNWGNE